MQVVKNPEKDSKEVNVPLPLFEAIYVYMDNQPHKLVKKIMPALDACKITEVTNGDNDIQPAQKPISK